MSDPQEPRSSGRPRGKGTRLMVSAAVGAALVPLALGSDTNGSVRVPAAFCGLFGLRPTYGRLSRAGTFPFVASLDTIGPLADSVRGLALAYDAMQGPDPRDPGCAQRAREASSAALRADPEGNLAGLRIARLGGWFEQTAQTWNRQPTPFLWNGKRRQRRRKRPGDGHAIGGSGAHTRHPVSRPRCRRQEWHSPRQVTH